VRAELFQRLILLSAHGFWFFILGAVASLGYGIGLLPFGPSGWKWIGNVYNYWRDSSARFRNSFSAGIGEPGRDEL